MSWARSSELSEQGRPLDDYFDEIFASYELGVVKPDARFFEHVLEATGSRPEETVFVDDGPHNMEAAKALGFHTLCPANGEHWREELTAMLDRLNRE
jgi:putative hydrolase of the HAD superfamily